MKLLKNATQTVRLGTVCAYLDDREASLPLEAWSYGVKCDTSIRNYTLTGYPVRGREKNVCRYTSIFLHGSKDSCSP